MVSAPSAPRASREVCRRRRDPRRGRPSTRATRTALTPGRARSARAAGIRGRRAGPRSRRQSWNARSGESSNLSARRRRDKLQHRLFLPMQRGFRQVDAEFHFAADRGRGVSRHLLAAAAAGVSFSALLGDSGLAVGAFRLRCVGSENVHQRGAEAVVRLQPFVAQGLAHFDHR